MHRKITGKVKPPVGNKTGQKLLLKFSILALKNQHLKTIIHQTKTY